MLTSSPALRSSPAKFLTSYTARSDDAADELKRTRRSFRRDLTTSFPARSNEDEFSDEADRLYKLRRTRRSLSLHLRNANKDLKDAVENICGDMHIKYLTFLRHLLIRMLSHPRAQTILVDGAFREGEPLIPLPSFKILVLLTFSSPSTGVKRVETVYPLLKDVALSPDMSFCVNCLFEGL
ncbi:hypothetical protein IGI04_014540 [Brassica rapa subsp. trilocularis]|uniref:Uncharacterized protein n=1 Tax=Brassica rapa subsp. trilocularis TaxID=1813537 RepID=A0ABQ7MMH2_BRACM|nr:hypothetical protein IGI04_014540 [Brassica rapa subsp. trilocularis]